LFLELEESSSDVSKSLSAIEIKEEVEKDPLDKAMAGTGVFGALIRRSSVLNPDQLQNLT
jgi:hypothetical protein